MKFSKNYFYLGLVIEDLSQNKNENIASKNIEKESGNDNTLEFADQQLNYQIKKLNSEINYIKDQLMALDVKSSLYADPFDIYNKEIMLNNGSSIFCKILSQTDTQIFVETLIGNLTIDRSSVVRIVENITCLLYTSPSPRDLSTSRMPSSA